MEDALLEEIARLISLQGIDRELQVLEGSLSTIAGRVQELRQEIDQAQVELDNLTKEDQQATTNRRTLEKELAEGEARIRNKRMRLNQVRNDKELQALGHEVETLKETNQRMEAELLVLMEAADPRTKRIQEITELVAQKSIELQAAEQEIATQVEDLKVSISKQRVDRDLMVNGMQVSVLRRYEMIFSRRAGLAVVAAKSGTCQGCRMRLPPQFYNEIQRHEQIYYCPNCQRILYFEANRES
jgi:predicted  nucleic acid-binding Zn-ribbon protein